MLELAGRTLEPDDPEAALAAVTALRGSLDELEEYHVSQAIEGGSSWKRIGALLGISKQAAHRRHAQRRRRRRELPPSRRHQLVVTGAAKQAVHLARLEASERGAKRAGTEDLLLGVIRLGEGPTGAAFDSLEITLSAARDQVAEFFGYDAPEYLDIGWRRLPLSRRGRETLEQAMREVAQRGDRRLDAEHVLLALIRDSQSGAVRTLAGLGTSQEAVQAALDDALDRRDEQREAELNGS